MKSARSGGFTLIELMVGLAILGLLLLAVLPDMTQWVRNTRVRNAAESIQNGMQKARMEALRRNASVTFWLVTSADGSCALSSAAGSWVISLDNPSGHCGDAASTDTAPRIVEAHSAGDGYVDVVVSSRATDGATAAKSVTFNGFGQVVNGSTDVATVNFTHAITTDTRPLRVTVAPGGGVRMCDPSVVSTDARAC